MDEKANAKKGIAMLHCLLKYCALLLMSCLCLLSILNLFSEILFDVHSRRIYILFSLLGLLVAVYSSCMIRFIKLERELSVEKGLEMRWVFAFLLLALGTAYPAFLHTRKVPLVFTIFGWVAFGIHVYAVSVLARWGYFSREFVEKAVYSLPTEAAAATAAAIHSVPPEEQSELAAIAT